MEQGRRSSGTGSHVIPWSCSRDRWWDGRVGSIPDPGRSPSRCLCCSGNSRRSSHARLHPLVCARLTHPGAKLCFQVQVHKGAWVDASLTVR